MCTYKILSHTDNGYIIRCNQCSHYQIGFGTSIICLSDEQYLEFRNGMQEQFDCYEHDGFPFQKTIQLSTFSKNSCMALTLHELKNLTTMVEEASLLMQVEHILANASHN
jgi:hypothetical protein